MVLSVGLVQAVVGEKWPALVWSSVAACCEMTMRLHGGMMMMMEVHQWVP